MASIIDAGALRHTLSGSLAQLGNGMEAAPSKKLLTKDLRDESSSLGLADSPSPGSPSGRLEVTEAQPVTTTSSVNATRPKKKPPRRATAESPNVCFECKTTDSKLWRRGPDGNLMCNACGLRWRRSNKAREAPKSSSRKRKLPSALSLSPQSPQPMALPQSSMSAAKRGGLLSGSFVHPNMYGALPGSNPNFGQLQYQPQNMYLHQQQQMAQQAQYRQQQQQYQQQQPLQQREQAQAQAQVHQQHQQQQHQQQQQQQEQHQQIQEQTIKAAPQIDPALMEDQVVSALATQGVAHTANNRTISSVSALDSNGTMSMPRRETPPNLAHVLRPGEALHVASLPTTQRLDIPRTSITAKTPAKLHIQSVSIDAEHDKAADNDDDTQHEDFAGLLSIKAFVDDTNQHY